MTSSFLVTLDRTAPPLALELVSMGAEEVAMIRLVSDAEAFEFRLWGDVDTGDPINATYGTTEAGAAWQTFEEDIFVKLPIEEFARIHVEVRDDVWNASDAQVLEFGVKVEPVEPSKVGAGPVQPPPRHRPPPDQRLTRRTRYVVTSSAEVEAELAIVHEGPIRTESVARTKRSDSRSSLLPLSSASKIVAGRELGSASSVTSISKITRGPDPAEEAAIVTALL